jgi:hypothetical protein
VAQQLVRQEVVEVVQEEVKESATITAGGGKGGGGDHSGDAGGGGGGGGSGGGGGGAALVRALLGEGHVAEVLLVAALPLLAQLVARLLDLAVVADEELVDEHRLRVLLGDAGEALPEG